MAEETPVEDFDEKNASYLMTSSDHKLVGMILQSKHSGYPAEMITAVLSLRNAKATDRLAIIGIVLTVVIVAATIVQTWAAVCIRNAEIAKTDSNEDIAALRADVKAIQANIQRAAKKSDNPTP